MYWALPGNYSNSVISTDITDERGYNELNLLCDGECLPFKDNQFDIVYSSNVLEHIPDKNKALNEMKRVLDDNGTIIIMVPTATWRIISCITYYPHEISYLLRLIAKKLIRPEKNYSNHFRKVNVENEKRPLTYYLRYTLPTVHGTYPNIFEETRSYLTKNWLKLFRNNGLEVVKVVKTLLYAPLEYPLPIVNLSRVGICSTVAFILKYK